MRKLIAADAVPHWQLIVSMSDRYHIPVNDPIALTNASFYNPKVCNTCADIYEALRRYCGFPATERCDHQWVCANCGAVKP